MYIQTGVRAEIRGVTLAVDEPAGLRVLASTGTRSSCVSSADKGGEKKQKNLERVIERKEEEEEEENRNIHAI